MPASSSPAGETLVARLDTGHFLMFAGAASESVVRGIANALEEIRPRILADLEVPVVGPTTVRIWQYETSFMAVLETYFGQRYPATGYVTGPAEIRVLAVPQAERNATHEFVHAVSLSANPSFANNPRWLWETMALYENREFVDPRSLAYLQSGPFPTLAQLNSDPNASLKIYDLGYVLGEFIVSRTGQPGLVALMRRNGDTVAVLGLNSGEFETAFASYVRERYLR